MDRQKLLNSSSFEYDDRPNKSYIENEPILGCCILRSSNLCSFKKFTFVSLISCLVIYVLVNILILKRINSEHVNQQLRQICTGCVLDEFVNNDNFTETQLDKNVIQKNEIIYEKSKTLPDIFSVDGWSYDTSRITRDYIHPEKISTLIEPKLTCGSTRKLNNLIDIKNDETDEIFLLIIICSAMGNFEARSTIRQTWGNQSNYEVLSKKYEKIHRDYMNVNITEEMLKTITDEDMKSISNNTFNDNEFTHPVNIKCLFLIGQSLDNKQSEVQSKINDESNLYDDIIQERFVDSYNNLTLKSVMMLKWVTSNCKDKVRYVMKTDDDMYINIPRLIEALQIKSEEHISKFTSQASNISKVQLRNIIKQERLLIGDLIVDAIPIRNITSKWYCPEYMYNGTVFPNYLSGTGYVMSYTTAEMIYKETLDTQLLYFEDIFVTGICSQKAGIEPVDHPGFSYYTRDFELCIFAYLISAHRVPPLKLKEMHNMMMGSSQKLEICEMKRILNNKN